LVSSSRIESTARATRSSSGAGGLDDKLHDLSNNLFNALNNRAGNRRCSGFTIGTRVAVSKLARTFERESQ